VSLEQDGASTHVLFLLCGVDAILKGHLLDWLIDTGWRSKDSQN
jgi:hypothetical protein